jgi:hypothetical protein
LQTFQIVLNQNQVFKISATSFESFQTSLPPLLIPKRIQQDKEKKRSSPKKKGGEAKKPSQPLQASTSILFRSASSPTYSVSLYLCTAEHPKQPRRQEIDGTAPMKSSFSF